MERIARNPVTWICLLVFAAFTAGGCKTGPQEKRTDSKAKPLTDQEAYLAENKAREGVVATASGLQYKVVREGKGERPKETDRVTVHYRGCLIDGKEFDSSYAKGEPAVFRVNGVIRGWVEALQLMREGAEFRLFIPSKLAYGEKGAGDVIGPNATLVFDVELLEVWEPDENVDRVYGDVEKAASLLRKGDFAQARALYERGLATATEVGFYGIKKHKHMLIGAHYNLACLQSLASAGKTARETEPVPPPSDEAVDLRTKALSNLKKALELGWRDIGHINKDPDLAPIRELPEFKALVEERGK